MSYQIIGHRVLSTQPLPKRAEDFPRGGKYSTNVPLSTFLAYLQPVQLIILDWYLYIKIMNAFTCGEEINKLAVKSSKPVRIVLIVSFIPFRGAVE